MNEREILQSKAEKIAINLSKNASGSWNVGKARRNMPDFRFGAIILYFISNQEVANFKEKLSFVRIVAVPTISIETDFKSLHQELLTKSKVARFEYIRP